MGVSVGAEFYVRLRVVLAKGELRRDFFHVAKAIAPKFQGRRSSQCDEGNFVPRHILRGKIGLSALSLVFQKNEERP